MEPLLEFLAAWWWAAPTTVGLGAVSYVGLTTGRRRARRLALDAARHEEQLAARAFVSAKADTRSAQAQLLSAQAQRGVPAPGIPTVPDARRQLQQAKQAQRAAGLALKAARSRVRAERVRMNGGASADLPLAQLVREHDALNARWLEYETDVETALAFPQMSDPHHPTTAAFLQAQRDAQWLRPAAATARMSPGDFVAYRRAVRTMEAAFTAAEDAALRATSARAATPPRAPARETFRSASAAPSRPAADTPRVESFSDAGGPTPSARAAGAPSPAADADGRGESGPRPDPLPQPVWPVPGRRPRPPAPR
ncbi:hypothetical protein [Microbacterium caowuchunii]|uniref:Uncharacterized protein n=1 Tax=Microbacterium caowuchunii TaxID=2614638 RepID=A0A5N0TJC0_9MICO|nr:hypothetical protein [Microbacterium caowuchunii]KAA9134548.1 hypothetical protein F6B40_07260 [Microbacterium caowuchunii]